MTHANFFGQKMVDIVPGRGAVVTRSPHNNYSQFLIVEDDKRIFCLGCKTPNCELVLYVLCFKLKYSEHFSYNWDPFVTPFITS